MTAVGDAIRAAERVLTHPPPSDGEIDLRWQALIDVAEFVRSSPDEIWTFVHRWGCSEDDEVRAAVATCLLEHLLQHHFDRVFPRVEEAVADPRFAATFCLCWKLGQAEAPANASRFDRVRQQIAERRAQSA